RAELVQQRARREQRVQRRSGRHPADHDRGGRGRRGGGGRLFLFRGGRRRRHQFRRRGLPFVPGFLHRRRADDRQAGQLLDHRRHVDRGGRRGDARGRRGRGAAGGAPRGPARRVARRRGRREDREGRGGAADELEADGRGGAVGQRRRVLRRAGQPEVDLVRD